MKHCKIFRSDKKAETYLYLSADLEFSDLPQELQERFGEPAFVMALMLTRERKLARVDTPKVLESLEEKGYYLQLPPKLSIEEEITSHLS